MIRFGTLVAGILLAAGGALAQEPDSSGNSPPEVFEFGSDYTLAAGQNTQDLVIVGGSVTIRGQVEGDAVVIGGSAELAGTGSVGGDFVVVGGSVAVAPGAAVDGDMVVVGGAVDTPPGFTPGGELVRVGPSIEGLMPFLTRGLLMGRPIVPDLPWVWAVVAVLLAVFLGFNLVFENPIRSCIEALERKPLTTFLIGLLVVMLAGPVSVLLAVSVVGLAVVPFLWAALAVAAVMGGVAVSRWLGGAVLRSTDADSRNRQALALLLGFVLICLPLMVPVLGAVSFASLGVLALGAAAVAVVAGLRKEQPVPIPASSGPVEAGPPSEPPAEAPAPRPPPQAPPPASQASPLGDLASSPRATFLARTGAFLLDVLLVGLIFGFMDLDEGRWFIALLISYHVALWSWKGATVGGVVAKLQVVRTDGLPLAFTDALVRGLASILSAVALGLGFFWILKEPERESWHDKIAGTCVVSVPKGGTGSGTG